MISDNFVVGDNVYLNELKNFFFEVLGMMSITHYGAIGDGRTDNYASLQVAIDDANRRGLCYLYVPYGRFRFRGNLINRENITFIGNPRARIFNDRTGEEIEIKQFGVPCCGNGKITFLEKNILLVNGTTPTLSTGSYFTGGYVVKINGDTIIPKGSTFYYDAGTKTLSWCCGYAKYEDGIWSTESGPVPEEDDEMKAIITAEFINDSSYEHAEAGLTEIQLDSSTSGGSMSELLELSDGGVVIGENVTQVKVSGMLTFTPAFYTIGQMDYESREFHIMRKRNGTTTDLIKGATRYYRNGIAEKLTIAIPSKLIDVQAGDKIVVAYDDFDASDYIEPHTFLTVEVVGYSDAGNSSNESTPNPTLNDEDTNPTIGDNPGLDF